MTTIRVKFTKEEDLKYISHLDLMRLFQRAFRRANIPIKYSQGFNPHPKFSLATALPLGVTSDGEYMDIELEKEINTKTFIDDLNSVLPKGIRILKASYVDGKKSLMSLIRWSTYIVEFNIKEDLANDIVENSINSILNKDKILITKTKRKRNKVIERKIDIRKYIKDIMLLIKEGKKIIIKTTLKTGSQGNLKPNVILDLLQEYGNLKIDCDNIKIHRLELFIEHNEKVVTPI
ncbi:TIGR03936 family radical SAM-associated protein [Thermohalobacter berrensis]|uniref:Radical SAM protein n=1 Tax=Thermohalobacter berrensis TaxID=99594 RepID=A0A419T6Z0_9FIRM|nr:TIGR03936 family radical SAM-associated protein [Thermohalobacter berrensis]RKD33212.1 radical SAM protein [Thermohalobacter berrensis]